MKNILSMAVAMIVLALSSNAMAAEKVAPNEIPQTVQARANKVTQHFCPAETRVYDVKQIQITEDNTISSDTVSLWKLTMSSDKKMAGDCGVSIILLSGMVAEPIAYQKAVKQ